MGKKKKTHGGFRKGAGRPTAARKSTNLCGVRVTPLDLDNYRDAAKRSGMTLTAWVKHWLDQGLDDVVDSMLGKGKKS